MKQIVLLITLQILLASEIYSQADTLWTKTFGSTYSEGANAVCETANGDYILAGYTYTPGGGRADIYVVKTDAQGNQLLQNTFGGTGWDIAYSVCNTKDNSGYIITGHTSSSGAGSKDVFLLKTDPQLNQLWLKTYGGPELDVGKSVCATSDGGYIICGYTESYGAGEDDIFLIKTNSAGDTMWTKAIGCNKSDLGHSVYETSDGHFIIAGSSGLYDTPGIFTGKNSEIFVVKTDLFGNVVNMQTFWVIDDDQGDFDAGYSICETFDGNYCVSGVSSAEGAEVLDLSVIKMDTSLTSIWKKRIEAGFYDFGYSVCAASPDGGVIVSGNFNNAQTGLSDLLIAGLDADGNEVWQRTYGGNGNDGARCIQKTSDDNFILAGHTSSYGFGSYDIWLLKFEGELTGIEDNKFTEPSSYYLNQNYPNPFNPITRINYSIIQKSFIKLSVYDVLGNEIAILVREEKPAGEYDVEFDGKELTSGIYFYQMIIGNFVETKKMLLLK